MKIAMESEPFIEHASFKILDPQNPETFYVLYFLNLDASCYGVELYLEGDKVASEYELSVADGTPSLLNPLLVKRWFEILRKKKQ